MYHFLPGSWIPFPIVKILLYSPVAVSLVSVGFLRIHTQPCFEQDTNTHTYKLHLTEASLPKPQQNIKPVLYNLSGGLGDNTHIFFPFITAYIPIC